MKLNSKVTGALAWSGLVLVLAIPSADMIFGGSTPKATIVSDTKQVKTAAIKPVTTQTISVPNGADPVQEFVQSGKKLPSYISGTPEVAVKPAPVKKPGTITINPDGTIEKPAVESASVDPKVVAPVVTAPKITAPTPAPASQRPKGKPAEAPLIVDETDLAAIPDDPDPVVSGDQLEEWDTGSLAEYLERKGLMTNSGDTASDAQYDADGFYLDQGPNQNKRSRVRVYQDDELLF